MKKLQILGVALVAICAFSAVIASAASATIVTLLATWLFETKEFVGNLPVETTGELLLEDKDAILGIKASVVCSGILHGSVNGENGEDEITELLNLAGTAISLTALSGTALSCTDEENCESPKVWAVHLPWQTLLVLVEGAPLTKEILVDLILKGTGGNAGWYVECTVDTVKIEDECTAPEAASEAVNVATGVEGIFSEALTKALGLKLALCSLPDEETGNVEGKGISKDTSAGLLAGSWELG